MRSLFTKSATKVQPIELQGQLQNAEDMQEQINQLRSMHQRLARDLEVVRNQVLRFETREVSENKGLAQRIDRLERLFEDGERPSKQNADDKTGGIVMANGNLMTGNIARAAQVFCNGPLLEAVQQAHVFPDSKTFVDMSMKDDPETIMQAFSELGHDERQDRSTLIKFVKQWFGEAGDDFEKWEIPDFKTEPPLLMTIRNPEMQEWALAINMVWPTLAIKHKPEVHDAPQRYSCLGRKHGMIVPGGRFREMYYWDTYWVMRGLLVCDMVDTAKGIIDDLISMVKEIGFIPNGGRIYYLDRSQPPLLTAMVASLYEVTCNKDHLKEYLPVLEQEYAFWMSPKGGRRVELPRLGSSNERQHLNIYRSMRDTPRPESYSEDMNTFKEAQALGRSPADIFRALASGAESGWDFSTRWLEDATGRVEEGTANLATIDTCHVIPVDLNCMLYHVEKTLAYFHREIEGTDSAASQTYDAAADRRERTMHSWLWVGSAYRDYRLDTGAHSTVVSISDYAVPLWAGLSGPAGFNVEGIINSLKHSGLLALCGAATTSVDSCGRTQWDAPNAWPPMNFMLVEGLDKHSGTEALADCLCETWLRNNFITWQRTGFMHEKYDSFEPGRFGAGGEYEPQVGFGWTNGTALALLVREPRVPTEDPVAVEADFTPSRLRSQSLTPANRLHSQAVTPKSRRSNRASFRQSGASEFLGARPTTPGSPTWTGDFGLDKR